MKLKFDQIISFEYQLPWTSIYYWSAPLYNPVRFITAVLTSWGSELYSLHLRGTGNSIDINLLEYYVKQGYMRFLRDDLERYSSQWIIDGLINPSDM